MPHSAGTARLERLNQMRARLAARRADSASRLYDDVQLLANLINEIDPIKRCVIWSVETVERIAARQKWTCPQCGEMLRPLNARQHHVDHVVPWSLGGGNELSNIQILHERCNLTKGRKCDYDTVVEYLDDRLRNI
jgi:5-methylcytosine-specific restriction endonuclease McrA